ncbi:hypothetical protein D3C76_1715890 [compost metagenome]
MGRRALLGERINNNSVEGARFLLFQQEAPVSDFHGFTLVIEIQAANFRHQRIDLRHDDVTPVQVVGDRSRSLADDEYPSRLSNMMLKQIQHRTRIF